MARAGNYLAADRLVWNRTTGEVRAQGNVVVVNPQGDKLIGDSVLLTDSLRDGTVDNLLVALESGGRIVAARGTRVGEVTTLENAAYSACPVTSEDGCPRNPSWVITAAQVIHDPASGRVRFRGGRLQGVRGDPAAAADLQRQRRRRRRDRLASAQLQDFAQERLRGRASLSLADRVATAT